MKTIQYLSNTSISLWEKNKEEFYLMYLSDRRPEKIPQTYPMSIGSAFDAYAKSFLHEALFGKGKDPKFEFNALFEAQVEPQHRDLARVSGEHAFDVYKNSGALADLMLDLQKALGPPRFELDVRGVVEGHREGVTKSFGGVTLLGKPDLFFINNKGAHVLLDWKVNGYASKSPVSPVKGYVRIREGGKNKGQHKDAMLMTHNGVLINVADYMDTVKVDWAQQLAIYGWLCGEEIGADFVAAVDQLACKQDPPYKPSIRIAEHRMRISRDFQWKVFSKARELWDIVHSDHIFRDLSREDSALRCRVLDGVAEAMVGDGGELDKWFASATRGQAL